MSIDLRIPNITGNEKEQLTQIRSYLIQLIPQLQWALNNVKAAEVSDDVVRQLARSSGSYSPSSSNQGIGGLSAEATFAKLKPLIIKSADIVLAYYEEINTKLKGQYVAVSDFGTFTETTSQEIKSTSTYTDQKFSNTQTIITTEVGKLNSSFTKEIGKSNDKIDKATDDLSKNINGVSDDLDKAKQTLDTVNTYVIDTQAHIKTGLIDDTVVPPVYGIEVGQRSTNEVTGEVIFNKYARFTSDRLSFYDSNDIEVAYISDSKLYIENVEIIETLKMGGFVDTVQPNGDIVTKWVGRS